MAAETTKKTTNIDTIHIHGIDIKSRLIYVNSDSYTEDQEELGVDFLMASKMIKNLDHLNSISSEPILIKMMNCGGDWFYGMAMFDAIAASNKNKSPVDIHAIGNARSMSSIILQAGRYRYLSNHTSFMMHYGTYGDYGDMRAVSSGMEHYQKMNPVMFNIYASRCYKSALWNGKTVSEVAESIEHIVKEKTDWWLTAEEAVNYGFADELR